MKHPHTINIDLSQARDGAVMHLTGHYLRAVEATPGSVLRVAFDSNRSREVEIMRGRGWKHAAFTRVYLSNDAQADASITLLVAGDPNEADPVRFDSFCGEETATGADIDRMIEAIVGA